jgi:hypothetical protein
MPRYLDEIFHAWSHDLFFIEKYNTPGPAKRSPVYSGGRGKLDHALPHKNLNDIPAANRDSTFYVSLRINK